MALRDYTCRPMKKTTFLCVMAGCFVLCVAAGFAFGQNHGEKTAGPMRLWGEQGGGEGGDGWQEDLGDRCGQAQGGAYDRFWSWGAAALRDLRPQQRHAVCDDGAGQDGQHHRPEDAEDCGQRADGAGAVAYARA